MTEAFVSRITGAPRAFDPAMGMDALARLAGLPPEMGELIKGAAGSSEHISYLIERQGEWFVDAMSEPPEAAFDRLLAAPPPVEQKSVMVHLRQQKARVALLTALADLGGVWSLEEVTGALTRFADHATDVALRTGLRREISRGKLPGQTEDDLAQCGGLAVLAMGKMGALELNYSSDIDLICLFDETRFLPDDYADARTSFVRAIRAMTKILSERTEDGYVFRTDLRLRPDASVTPVAISMEAAERYYESFGRTWERAAFIKARAAAGDIAAGERFLQALTPFIWRRHLDYAAIQDAQDMRLRIRDHKGLHSAPSHLGHDLKLGQGGIREIEFFTQTRQIIAGGRDETLRDPTTVGGLRVLAEKDWISFEDATQLTEDYRAHREAEHRVQMIADQQTHLLPDTEEGFARLAALAGRDSGDYARDITERLERVHRLTDVFFAPEAASDPAERGNFADAEMTERWSGYPALRSPRAVEIFDRVWPKLRARLAKASQPDDALLSFDGFLAGLPAGVQLFSLFEANPQLLDLVVDIVDVAPGLGWHLARNSEVFDAVLGGGFFADWPGSVALEAELTALMGREEDYEKKLDVTRIWAREWKFRVGVHHLRGLIDAAQSGQQYADLARAVVRALWGEVARHFAKKHGAQPGRGAAVVAMGSLGAEHLNAGSDLDLIVIYDGAGVDASNGARPLPTRSYFARLTQAFITALSAPTSEGLLYDVDMRLRPSGRKGPVATSFEAFRSYQTNEAWTWEHLALTRAQSIAGDLSLCSDIGTFRETLLSRPHDKAKVLADAGDMRARLGAAKANSGPFDVQFGPGRWQDLQLFAQAGALLAGASDRGVAAQLRLAGEVFDLTPLEMADLSQTAQAFWRVQAALRLIEGGEGAQTVETPTGGVGGFLLRGSGFGSIDALTAGLKEMAARADLVITRSIGRSSGLE
ncbi:glutamine-synthetase adenylyltransferase [Rhodobacteraceae bacterium]|nr:glutamine-synthetase adenylyltransferase [Paracoccaceae bacterium]